MKVAVIGSRGAGLGAYARILGELPQGCSEIISGGARGVDSLAKKAAAKLNIKYTCLRPSYSKYGRAAPLIRNNLIIERADCVLAFWDGYSKGTKHALGYCIKIRKPFKIYLLNKHDMIFKNG